jgi:hydroxymethylpyrimidine/phosphomethylpyrimidine kinase
VKAQIKSIFDDIRVDALKIGMIANAEISTAVAEALADVTAPIVLDPVMIAKGGAPLLQSDAVAVVRDRLVPMAHVITPNLPEAAALLGADVASDRSAMAAQGEALMGLGARAVLLKGGHLDGPDSPDCLETREGTTWFEAARVQTQNTHGTGCTLSSALATHLANGLSPEAAVRAAKTYIQQAIARSGDLSVGSGHGPTHHFAAHSVASGAPQT